MFETSRLTFSFYFLLISRLVPTIHAWVCSLPNRRVTEHGLFEFKNISTMKNFLSVHLTRKVTQRGRDRMVKIREKYNLSQFKVIAQFTKRIVVSINLPLQRFFFQMISQGIEIEKNSHLQTFHLDHCSHGEENRRRKLR